MAAAVPLYRLERGLKICRILNGMWQVSGSHGPIDRKKASRDMLAYFDAGLTTFDMADIYGPAEEIFGDFLQHLKEERGENSTKHVQGNIFCRAISRLLNSIYYVTFLYGFHNLFKHPPFLECVLA